MHYSILAFNLLVLQAFIKFTKPHYKSGKYNDRAKTSDDIVEVRSRRAPRAATSQTSQLWPGGIIPFELTHNYTGHFLEMIYASMHMWNENSCILFTERTTNHLSWLRISPGRCGCCSQVGMQGRGPQDLHISKECDRVGIIAHEMGHALGFWHEHTRPDRDDYIYLVEDNIENEQFYNFEKKSFYEVDSLGEPYDAESIMHYGPDTFSKTSGDFTLFLRYGLDVNDRERFIEAMSKLGQRIKPSEGDISQLNKLYRCPPCGGNLRLRDTSQWLHVKPKENIAHCKYCRWRLITSLGNRVRIRIESIRLQPGQFAMIYDGAERNFSRLMGYVNGYQRMFKPPLISKQSSVLVELWSTDLYRPVSMESQFKLNAKASCGGVLTDRQGVLTNPGFPLPTSNSSLLCVWSIPSNPSSNIMIKVRRLLLKDDGLQKSSLTITENTNLYESVLLSEMSNVDITGEPFVVLSNKQGQIHVRLKVAERASALVWLEYFTKTDPCNIRNAGCDQLCQQTEDGHECKCDVGYRLRADKKSCFAYKYVNNAIKRARIFQFEEIHHQVSCKKFIRLSHRHTNGSIKNPAGDDKPGQYENNLSCFWVIIAPKHRRIKLNFRFMEIEGMEKSCLHDRLTVKGPTKEGNGLKSLQFCGNRLPKPLTSLGNILNITFVTDGTNSARGFHLDYSMI